MNCRSTDIIHSPLCDNVSHLTASPEAELQDGKELRRSLDMTPPSHETSSPSIIHTDPFDLGVLVGVGGSPHPYHGNLVFFFFFCNQACLTNKVDLSRTFGITTG